MPMDFLHRIEHAELPLTVSDHRDIDRVALLHAAGYVKAVLDPNDLYRPATVVAITAHGLAVLINGGAPGRKMPAQGGRKQPMRTRQEEGRAARQ